MQIRKPAYYDLFRCLAGACPDSCCKEWEVDIDPDTAQLYRSLQGPLGERLRQVLRTEDGVACMTIENGRCPMWRPDGLCRIQAELGHDALSQTCRDYPRLRHDYGDFVELGLELSCPEAARLIFSEDHTLLQQEMLGGDAPEYDAEAMEILLRSRTAVMGFLDQDGLINEKLAALLLYAHGVQEELDGGDLAEEDWNACLDEARRYSKPADAAAFLDFFRGLEILTDRWRERLKAPKARSWDPALVHLAQYGIWRYWLQAVSDYDLIGRVKLIIIGCVLVHLLGDDTCATAQLFSKEIENAPDNVDAILDGAYTAPAFTDMQLLGLLLGENDEKS